MRIRFKQRVKHAGRCHEAGDEVTVDEGMGTYLASCGWADVIDGPAVAAKQQPGEVTLDVQDSVLGHSAANVGA